MIEKTKIFSNCFILDLANNHEGSLEHGLTIIEEIGRVSKCYPDVELGIKFQCRDIESIVHPDYLNNPGVKHISRFVNTKLQKDDYCRMIELIRKHEMFTIATPFDEPSVDMVEDLDVDVIKIASCSAEDRPLIERVTTLKKPVVFSTGGVDIGNIDNLVNTFQVNQIDFALMHCVAIYPTPNCKLNLNRIGLFKKRYHNVEIGFSSHECPDNWESIMIAYAMGARIFERHIGLPINGGLNAYSLTPNQVRRCLDAYRRVKEMLGPEGNTPKDPEENESLLSLYRGVFAKKRIYVGQPIKREDVFFAMPLIENRLRSSDWVEGQIADQVYEINEPLNDNLSDFSQTDGQSLSQILLQVRTMLNLARIRINRDCAMEVSHHYGLARFREYGCFLITCIDRDYCKKIIVQFPLQKHPYHLHQNKEETYQILSGDLVVCIDGVESVMKPGNTCLIPRMAWHKFHSINGAIVEEISTRHVNDDSLYDDPQISLCTREARKTFVCGSDICRVFGDLFDNG